MKKSMLIAWSFLCVFATCIEAKETGDAVIYSKADYTRLEKGNQVDGEDHQNPYFDVIPKEFEGRKISVHPQLHESIDFKVKKAGLVTILVRKGLAPGFIAQGWTEVGRVVYGPNYHQVNILQKRFEVGNHSIQNENQEIRLLK